MDFSEQIRILQAAEGNLALLTLAAVDLAFPSLSADERARIKDALVAAAVPHWVDPGFLTTLLRASAEEGEHRLGQLRALTVVESFPARGENAVNVHEAARLALRDHLRTTDPSLWRDLSERARAHVSSSREPHARIEALFHLFAVDQPAAASACGDLDREFTTGGNPELRHALAIALRELSTGNWLTGSAQVEALLAPLEVRCSRGDAASLEGAAREVVELSRDASYPAGTARSLCLLGDVLLVKGRLDDALVVFHESLVIFARLVAVDPASADWQHDFAVAHSRVGDVHEAQGRLEEALAAFRAYLAISTRLVAADPASAAWQRELAVAHAKVGGIHQAQDRPDEALSAFRECLDISTRLAAADPANAGWQRELSVAHAKVGDAHQAQDRLDEALAAFREDLAIAARLAAADPANAGWQRDLAVAHSKVGDVHQAQGRPDEALAAFQKCLAIAAHLAAADPANAGWQRDLAIMHSKVGDVHEAQGRPDEALAAFREDLAISARLAAADPTNAGWQRDLALAHHRIANVAQEPGEARSNARLAISVMERAAFMASENMGWQRDLAALRSIHAGMGA